VLSIVVPTNWIASTSSITNGQGDPTVRITGSGFISTISISSLNINVGTTGLNCTTGGAAVTWVASTEFTLHCIGTARTGTLSVQAKTTAFTPAAATVSNTVEFMVPAPVIASTSTITNHQTADSVSLAFTGTLLNASMTISDLVVDVGTTGLTCATLTGKTTTTFTLTCTGTPVKGTVSVQAKTSAFSPADTSYSNVKSFVVAAPQISAPSSIANGTADPSITVTGVGFDTGVTATDFNINYGTTGLSGCAVGSASSTSITLDCVGTARAGSLTIQAKTSAYSPADYSVSNTRTITVAAPAIADGGTSISIGASGATIKITGALFASGVTLSDFYINVGTTSLTSLTVVYKSATSVWITFSGTVTAGTVTVRALSSAYDPADTTSSNTLSFTAT